MISPTTTPQYFTSSSASNGTTQKKSLDKDAFMTLLVAQLRHQDPLNPLQPHEMAAQLAQFTSVEQLTQLNTAMAAQTEASQMATLSAQSSLSASLIGRQVEAAGDQVVVPSTGKASVLVDVANTGGAATLTLKNDSGAVICTRKLGQVGMGTHQTLSLPSDLPPGRWHYSIDVQGPGKSVGTVTTYSTGVVTAVEFKSSGIVLQAGSLEIALTDLIRVEPASTSSSTATDTSGNTSGSRESTPPQTPNLPPGAPDDDPLPNPHRILDAIANLGTRLF